MEIDDFNENYLKTLINQLTKENSTIYLLGDFNLDLLQIETNEHISNFYDILTENLFVPHITLPTRLTSHSKTLIDNIFSNDPDFINGVSGNFTISISDHLPQFLIMPEKIKRIPKKHNIYQRTKNYSKEELVADFLNTDWKSEIETDKMDANLSFEIFHNKYNKILNKHVPLKKVTKKDLKLKTKPWITTGILKSIKRRDKLLNLYKRSKGSKP